MVHTFFLRKIGVMSFIVKVIGAPRRRATYSQKRILKQHRHSVVTYKLSGISHEWQLRVQHRLSLLAPQLCSVLCFHYSRIFRDFFENIVIPKI